MKMKMIALAGVATLALAGPAVASDAHGWYLGLGAGWDHMGNFEAVFDDGTDKINTSDSALFVGSIGYRFMDRIRLEGEFGYDRHSLRDGFDGHVGIKSAMLNAAYDLKLSQKWDLTFGAGVGWGSGGGEIEDLSQTHDGYIWQAMVGFAY
jgi:opacity protein-like surface antigen